MNCDYEGGGVKLGEKFYEAAEVLAGAYRGKDIDGRALLIHTIEFDMTRKKSRALCGYRNLDNLITDAGDPKREPTCPKCSERLAKLREKNTLR